MTTAFRALRRMRGNQAFRLSAFIPFIFTAPAFATATFNCSTSATTVTVNVTNGTASDSLLVTTSAGTYAITLNTNTDPSCVGISDSTYSTIQVVESPTSVPTTFQVGSDYGVTFDGVAGAQNTLDLGSAIAQLVTVNIGINGAGTVSGVAPQDAFSNVSQVLGSEGVGGTIFDLGPATGTTIPIALVGRGTGTNKLSLAAMAGSASAPPVIDTVSADVSLNSTMLASFTGMTEFSGSDAGYTTFTAGTGNAYSFSGAGTSNTLSFAQIPAGGPNVVVTYGLNASSGSAAPATGGAYTFTGIQNFVGSPNGDVLNFANAPAGVSVNFSGNTATVVTANGSVTATGMAKFIGSSSGQNTFAAPAGGNHTFTAGGAGNTLDLSALAASASSPLTIDLSNDSASNASVLDDFSGFQSFKGSSQGNTLFTSNGTNGLSLTGQGSGNSLDLSAAPSGVLVHIDTTGNGTVIAGRNTESFTDVTAVKGSSSGATTFASASGSGATVLTLTGQGNGNSLNLSSLTAPTIDTVKGSYSSGPTMLATFAGIQTFVGSSGGNSTFQAGQAGGYNFMGQANGNILSFAEITVGAVGVQVFLNPNGQGQESANPGSGTDTFTGITSIIGSPNSDTFFGGPGNYSISGHAGDTVSYASASNGANVSFSGATATVTGGGYSGSSTVTGVTVFIGSPNGNNTFAIPAVGGYTFECASGSTGNILDLSAAPSGATIAGSSSGNVSGLQPGIAASTTDSYQNIQSFENVPQNITFTSAPPTNAIVNGTSYTPVATSSSGLTVALSIDASSSSVCAINGSGVVSFAAKGNCTIDANQTGNGEYRAATLMRQTFTVYGTPTQLAFTTQPPSTIVQGYTLGTIVVAAQDSSGVGTPASGTVDFTIAACGGAVDVGTAQMTNGVATLNSGQRLYTMTNTGQSLTIAANMGGVSGTSSGFDVIANSDLIFSGGFESCRL